MDKATVLIVDDVEDNLILTSMILEDDYNVATAISGDQCLQEVESITPDVIVLDVNMPGMNGLELLQHVKKEFPNISVSMITAYSNQYYEAAIENGADHYYTKPLDFTMLKRELLHNQGND